MKFCIVGAGGIGGYFGARLAADGNDVIFAARGAHRAAMEKDGLKLLSPLGDLHIPEPQLLDDPADVGLCDFVLICVKLWDLEAAAELVRPLLARDTAVLPLQNGVTAEDTVADILGPEHVMGGVALISARIEAPGVIRHNGTLAKLTFGERDGEPTWRQEVLLSACIGAGIEATASADIEAEIWRKFVFLAPLAGATSFYRAPIGGGRAKGVALPDDIEDRTIAFLERQPPDTKASMLVDLERGRRLELDWLNGAVVRLGAELGVPTPENAAVTEALKPYAMGEK
jgi:2-dehydropantoate 2-reductase